MKKERRVLDLCVSKCRELGRSWEAGNSWFCFILKLRSKLACCEGYFFLLDIIGLIVTFKVN